MPHSSEFDNNFDSGNESKLPIEKLDGKPETALVEHLLDESLKKIDESPVNQWMKTVAPFLKFGGRPVAIILALGFISIPLMVTGSPWVALTLAIGASITAVCSCFNT